MTGVIKYCFSKNPFFFIWLLLICVSCRYKTTDENNYISLENKLQELNNDGELIGAEVLIIENQKQTFHKSVGWADKDSDKKLENESIWTMMSMTKPFTATAILMLMEDGKLSLDDSVLKYFPNFKGNPQVTIRNLLEQSSGDDGNHGNGGHNVTEFETLDDWITDWAMQEALGTFGEFAYSNFNYGALASIVEKVSGKPIETFLTERIIIPLNLQHTYVKFSTDENWTKAVPSRYRLNDSINKFEKSWSNTQQASWKLLSGALGLWMSAKDYAVFMQMWLNKGKHGNLVLLKESTVNEALKIHVNAYGEESFGHGYGWFIEEKPLIFRYGGSAGGFAKACISKNSIVIYMTHSSGGNHKEKFEDDLDQIWFPNHN